ncbi:unnamed protein product [Lactuca virosa]|uniref:Uncharacterized protein n=1 Tax=Lactuca virosa TaxID=75947 RepID=A0AAU9P5N2_9ASTR|nr:unnamed protein product [Lactuca virosa]
MKHLTRYPINQRPIFQMMKSIFPGEIHEVSGGVRVADFQHLYSCKFQALGLQSSGGAVHMMADGGCDFREEKAPMGS